MSYCSENRLPLTTSMNRLFEVVELLGYHKALNPIKIKNNLGSYIWYGDDTSISFVGLELDIYKEESYISVQTRTRIGRSFWELRWQNKTISLLKALFGGSFSSDAGTNRYMWDDEPEPKRIAASLYVARWVFNNALTKPKVYLQTVQMTGNIAHEERTGIDWLDMLNPRILSGNMMIPYLIGCWEAYFRNSYISILKYADHISENALKSARISSKELLMVIKNSTPLEQIITDSLSFQRPNIISENFRKLDPSIDIASWLRKPYHRRKKTLFDSVSEIIDIRDSIVHTGDLNLQIMDKQINRVIDDLIEAVNRVYDGFGQVYGFKPDYSF